MFGQIIYLLHGPMCRLVCSQWEDYLIKTWKFHLVSACHSALRGLNIVLQFDKDKSLV